jgi:hypothetical protein
MSFVSTPLESMTDDQLLKEYSIQRRNRMGDCLDDYLNDPKVDPRQIYEEMLSCLNDNIKYQEESLKKAVDLKELMLGYRHIDLNLPERY